MTERLMLRDLADSLLLTDIEHLRPKPEPIDLAPDLPVDPAPPESIDMMALLHKITHKENNDAVPRA